MTVLVIRPDACVNVNGTGCEIKTWVVNNGHLSAALVARDSMVLWTPVIAQRESWPKMHILLRCALSLTASSVHCERLFSLINRLNRHDEVDTAWCI